MAAYIGIDVGARRVGLARADAEARLASAWQTVAPTEVASVLSEHGPWAAVVVGLPRNLDGRDTPQTLAVRRFVDDYLGDYEVVYQDEAGTSSMAEERLRQAGKPFAKGDIDAEAAAIILQDYLDELA